MGVSIVISGVPGTGKTVVSIRLAKLLKAKYINLSKEVISNRLYSHVDERGTYVIDEDAVRNFLRKKVVSYDGFVVIDSHYGEIVDDDLVLKIIVLRLHPRELLKRLVSRGWNPAKVRENVEAEILGVCTFNALQEHPADKVCEVDTTGKSVDQVIREVMGLIKGGGTCRVGIDWLKDESVFEVINELERMCNLNYGRESHE